MAIVSAKSVFNKAKGPIKVVGSDDQNFTKTDSPGFLESLWSGAKDYGAGVGKQYYGAAKNIVSAIDKAGKGEQSPFSAALQSSGQVAKAVFAPVTEAVGMGLEKTGLDKSAGQAISSVAGTEPAQKIIGFYKSLSPEQQKNLEAILEIGTAVAGAKGAQSVAGAAEQASKNLVTAAKGARGTIGAGVEATLNPVKGAVNDVVAGSGGIVSKLEDVVTDIPKSVETELTKPGIKPYSRMAKFNEYVQQAEKATASNAEMTPLELAGTKGEKALSSLNEQIKTAGSQKTAITTGIGNTNVGNIVEKTRSSVRKEIQERLGSIFTKEGELRSAPGRASKIEGTDASLLRDVDSKLAQISKNPTFQKVDDAIDYIQNKLYERSGVGAVPVNSQVEGILKKTIGDLNTSLKGIGGKEYTKLNEQLSKLIEVRNTLNKALGSEGNKGAALMKQLFSPSGTMPRKLFDEINKLTGIDLVNESTLAKYAMEIAGDVRQQSLLAQVLEAPQEALSKSGLLNKAIDKVTQKLKNPQAKSRRLIKSVK